MKIKIYTALISVLFIINTLYAQQPTITTSIAGPYSNKISAYTDVAKVSVIYNIGTYCCWDNNFAAVKITNNTTGATLVTKTASRVSIPLGRAGGIYTLTSNDLIALFDQNSWDITGFSSAELTEFATTGTLPDGIYSFCFEFWASMSVFTPTNQTAAASANCQNGMNISKANQQVQLTVSFSKPAYVNAYDWFAAAGNLNITALSTIETFNAVSLFFEISGPAGILIKTKNLRCTTLQKFSVGPGSPHVANVAELQDWLDLGNMDISGLGAQFLADRLLPDGNYQIKIYATESGFAIPSCTAVSNVLLNTYNFTVQRDPISFTPVFTPKIPKQIEELALSHTLVSAQTLSTIPNARIGIRIRGSNGINISSISSGAPVYSFSPGIPVQLNPSDFQWLFNRSNLQVNAGNAGLFSNTGELPDGSYEICWEAYDAGSILVSKSYPLGCESPFVIGAAGSITSLNEMPIIILPTCGLKMNATEPQNLVMNWLVPSSFNVSTKFAPQEYVIRMVEMNEKTDPYDAYRNATTPFFFEKTITGNSYIYNPADPKLEPGKKYAFTVTINKDRSLYRNNGQSDICWFQWGGITDTQVLKKPPVKLVLPPATSEPKNSIVLLSPEDSSVISLKYNKKSTGMEYTARFKWDLQGPLSGKRFRLFIAEITDEKKSKEQAFLENPNLAPSTLITGEEFDLKFTTLLQPGRVYAWKVKAFDGSDKETDYSPVWRFQVPDLEGSFKLSGTLRYRYYNPTKDAAYNGVQHNQVWSFSQTINVGVASLQIGYFEKDPVSGQLTDITEAVKAGQYIFGSEVITDAGKSIGGVPVSGKGLFEFKTSEYIGPVDAVFKNTVNKNVIRGIKVVLQDNSGCTNCYSESNLFTHSEYAFTDKNDAVGKEVMLRVRTNNLKVVFKQLKKVNYGSLSGTGSAGSTANPNVQIYLLRFSDKPVISWPDREASADATHPVLQVNQVTYRVIDKKTVSYNSYLKEYNTAQFKHIVTGMGPGAQYYVVARYEGKNEWVMDPEKIWPSNGIATKDPRQYDLIEPGQSTTVTIQPYNMTNVRITGNMKYKYVNYDPANSKTTKVFANGYLELMNVCAVVPKSGGSADWSKVKLKLSSGMGGTYEPVSMGVVTKTDDNGNFEFNTLLEANYAPDASPTSQRRVGLIAENATVTDGGSGTYYGDVYRVLMIRVVSPYLKSPSSYFIVQAGYDYDVGELKAEVQSTSLTVTVKDGFNNKMLAGAPVYLVRRSDYDPAGKPAADGDPNSVMYDSMAFFGNSWKVFAEGTTDKDGKVKFTHLLRYDMKGDICDVNYGNPGEKSTNPADKEQYRVIVKPDEFSDVNYSTWGGQKPRIGKPCEYKAINLVNGVFDQAEMTIGAFPLSPSITGAVYPESNYSSSPLEDAVVSLYKTTAKGKAYFKDLALKNALGIVAIIGPDFWKSQGYLTFVDYRVTGTNGKFSFESIDASHADGWMVFAQRTGFVPWCDLVNLGQKIEMGQKKSYGKIFLKLPVKVNAKIVSNDNSSVGVSCKVIVGNQFSWAKSYADKSSCTVKKVGADFIMECIERAELLCPTGKIKLYVIPDNLDMYMTDSMEIDVSGSTKNVNIFVRTRKKRFDFLVKDKRFAINNKNYFVSGALATMINANPQAFSGINCAPEGQSPVINFKTNPQCEFLSSGKYFTFDFTGSATYNGSDISYAYKRMTVQAKDDEFLNTIDVNLEVGAIVKGKVRDQENKPVKGAKVFVDASCNKGFVIETVTDADGNYRLEHVPFKDGVPLLVNATLPGANAVGESKVANPPVMVMYMCSPIYNADFTVTKVDYMSVKSFMGFPVELYGIKKKGSNYLISGRFVNFKDNAVFSFPDQTSLSFDDAEVIPPPVPSTAAEATLAAGFLNCNETILPMLFYTKTKGRISGVSDLVKTYPIRVRYADKLKNTGAVVAVPQVFLANFAQGISTPNKKSISLLNDDMDAEMNVALSTGLVPEKLSSGLRIGMPSSKFRSGNDHPLILHNIYDADADPSGSFLANDVLTLKTTLHTKIEGIEQDGGDLKIQIGTLIAGATGLQSLTGKNPLKIALDKWEISATKWEFGTSGLKLKEGVINAGASVPFTDLLILPKEIGFGKYQLDKISLAGVVDLDVNKFGSLVSFGYDKGFKSWALTVLPGAGKTYCSEITNLPYFTGKTLKIYSISSFSTGKFKVNIASGAGKGNFYQIAQYEFANLQLAEGVVYLQGNLDLQIPKMQVFESWNLKFVKTGGVLDLQPADALPANTFSVNGARYRFTSDKARQKFVNGKLEWYCTVEDEKEGLYLFKDMFLTKTLTETKLVSTHGKNRFYLDKDTSGSAAVQVSWANQSVKPDNSGWNNLRFGGNIVRMDGVKSAESYGEYEVKGDVEVDASSSKIGVNNIKTPFGNLNITFDVIEKALIGSMHVNSAEMGEGSGSGNTVTMDIEMRLGGGNWYMFGSGKVYMPQNELVKELKSAFYVGSSKQNKIPPVIPATFKSFSYDGNFLPSFFTESQVAGVALAGGFSMPIPKLPEIDIDLDPVVHVTLQHQISANGQMTIGISKGIEMGLYFDISVWIHATAGGSIGLACGGASLTLDNHAYANGSLNLSTKRVTASAGAEFNLTGSAYVGVGCCDSDCDDCYVVPCFTHSFNGSIGVGANLKMDSQGSPKLIWDIYKK